MHRAEINMVVCAKALLNVARKMEDRFGIPFFEGSIYGDHDVSNALREFGYAGYSGMAELARQLALTMESPVWAAVRRPAPWAKAGVSGAVLVA